jgi:hypothetical protein
MSIEGHFHFSFNPIVESEASSIKPTGTLSVEDKNYAITGLSSAIKHQGYTKTEEEFIARLEEDNTDWPVLKGEIQSIVLKYLLYSGLEDTTSVTITGFSDQGITYTNHEGEKKTLSVNDLKDPLVRENYKSEFKEIVQKLTQISQNVGIIPTASLSDLTVTRTNLEDQRKGSINPSNLCYLNSACTLFSNDYAHLLSNDHDVVQREGESEEDFGKRQTLQRCLRRVEFHINAAQGPVPADETTAVLDAIKAIKSGDDNWAQSTIHTQNTSAEALNIMIDALSDAEGSAPIIEQVLSGATTEADRSTIQTEATLSLGLPGTTQRTTPTGYVNQDVDVSFGRLVESYFSKEEIPDHATHTSKQARLGTAPPTLSFEIKRAVVMGDGIQQAKNLSNITDIPETLDIEPFLKAESGIEKTQYRLSGFSLHSGLKSTSGHYLTASINPHNKRWELLSDSYVKSFDSLEELKTEVERNHLSPLTNERLMNFGEAIAAVNYRKVDA